jgi:ELWxxDGT repeat protein
LLPGIGAWHLLPELVHEFFPGPGAPARFRTLHPRADLGGALVFAPELGFMNELWRTDGTDAGTFKLTSDGTTVDSIPGVHPTVAGGQAFFHARRAVSGEELWVTDGTVAGTRELDLVPGNFGSSPYLLTPFGDGIVFNAGSRTTPGQRLWRSDGTDAGTAPITEAVQPTSALAVHQGLIYFLGTDGFNTQLWRSDGTAAGTVQLPDLVPGHSIEAESLTSLGSRLLLWNAYRGFAQQGLWVTDGTATGTKRISNVSLQFSLSGPLEHGGVVYFVGFGGAAELLWRTDGTEAGTYPLRDRDGRTIANPALITLFDGKLYFIAADLGATLWQSDGTPQGTFPLRELEPGQRTSLALGVAGSRLFFRAFDPAMGAELWAIDGH